MSARTLIVALVAAVAVAVAALLLRHAPAGHAVPDAPPTLTEHASVDEAAQPANAGAPIDGLTAAPSDDERTTATPAAAPPGPQTLVTGRCVDADGAPLAGCRVRMHGWFANETRRAEWMKQHAEPPAWRDPEDVVTAADGTFAFLFWPPPPLQFSFAASFDGRVPVTARWGSLAPGSRIDLGDLVMAAGVRVHGRVVDTRGAAPQRLTVSLYQQPDRSARQDQAAPIRGASAQSAPDGSFEMQSPIPPGNYFVSTTGLPLVSPAQFEVSLDHPDALLEIVVTSLADIPRITGRVLDMDGKPVEDAVVSSDRNSLSGQEESYTTRTRHDGRFDLRADDTPKGKTVALVVEADDCECDPVPREVAWGTTDVEFRVVRGGELTVRVTDPEGRPVEHYTLRMIPRRSNQSTADGRVRSQGRHDDGIATVPGLKRGDWLVAVEFSEADGYDILFAPLQLDAPKAVRLDLVARPPNERPLRVVFADGTPSADSMVRLCDAFGTPMHDYRAILSLEHWHMNAGNASAVLALRELRTDADGRATLRGPAGRDLVLDVTSERHLPHRLEGVRLDTAAELVVRVSAGAALRGRAGPPAAFDELRRLAGLEPGADFGYRRPHLSLRAAQGHACFPPTSAVMAGRPSPLQLADDGTFAAGGIPPGAWLLELNFQREVSGEAIQVGEVTLVDAVTTERDVDLSAILPGTLEGTVLHNGVRLANQRVLLVCAGIYHNLTTDADGRFTLRAIAGTCTCRVELDGSTELEAVAPVPIVRGETRRGEFQLFSGRARLRLLGPDGEPVSQVRLMRRDAVRPRGYFLPITDVDGRVTLDLPPGRYTFHALPKRLTVRDEMARIEREARAAGRDDHYGRYLLDLGDVTLQAGDEREVELRLPAEWAQ